MRSGVSKEERRPREQMSWMNGQVALIETDLKKNY